MKSIFKKFLPSLISVVLLFIFSCILFYPQLEGKKIVAGDSISSVAKSKHIKDYWDSPSDLTYWNSAQFSGGPIYLLGLGKESNLFRFIDKLITFNHYAPIGMFFAIGLVMFLSLQFLSVRPWISLAISISFMLSLIFHTLIEAGHDSKVYTLLYLPLVLTGVILFFKEERMKGAVALLLGTSLAIYSGHVQMVYYMLIALTGFGLVYLGFQIKNNKLKPFGISIGIALAVATIAAGTNFAQLKTSNDFSKQTMRGGSILSTNESEQNEDTDKTGLKWDYAMSWSYEIQDFFNIIVPRVVGGGSQEKVDENNPLAKLMLSNNAEVKDGKVVIPGYWSTMPFTSGGAYLGIGVFFLFVLSLFVIKRDLAFGFIAAFILIFLLSLGENATWFNKLLYNNLPLFDKFRAPSSAISILPMFISIGAALGINELVSNKSEIKNLDKKLYFALAIVAGGLAILWLVGLSKFSFLSPNDLNYDFNIQQVLIDGRKELFNNDIKRSLGFVIVNALLVWLWIKNKIKNQIFFTVCLIGLIVLDIMPIDKRYLDNDSFTNANSYALQFAPRPSDQQISQLEKKGRGFYRVLDLSVNTFNDAKPSYHHNQIGGYDPTKLQRYQDIIDYHISKNNSEVLNMLNTKYVITNQRQVQTNPNANGTAWFVSNLKKVATDMDEIMALNGLDSKNTAVIKTNEFPNIEAAGDGTGSIELITYEPNKLVYKSNSTGNQLAIFSETWYGGEPGWKATIDGNETAILRANYVLRALEIPSGQHEIIMEFSPKPKGRMISLICSAILLILIILLGFKQYKDNTENQLK